MNGLILFSHEESTSWSNFEANGQSMGGECMVKQIIELVDSIIK